MSSKYRISVNLSETEYKEILAISETHKISLAWLGRQAIAQLLEKYHQEELQLPLALLNSRSQRQ